MSKILIYEIFFFIHLTRAWLMFFFCLFSARKPKVIFFIHYNRIHETLKQVSIETCKKNKQFYFPIIIILESTNTDAVSLRQLN